MIKKLQILLLLLFAINLPLAAQHTHFQISYQSFRPFVHFQLNFNSHDYSYHDSYESAYLKGYMDGVNDHYYYHHRFDDLVWDIDAYEAGYRDGFRDHKLLIRLRGHHWYKRHRFAYDDYYAPSYSVRIWLDGLSLAFLQAPVHRLPHRWKHHAHPHVKHYRRWMAKHRHHKAYDDYYSSVNVERRFNKRIRGYRKQAHKVKTKHRKTVSRARDHRVDQRYRQNRAFKKYNDKHIKRSKVRKHTTHNAVRKHEKQRRKAIKNSKERKRSRGTVTKKRADKKSKSKRNRGRSSRERKRDG